MTNWHDFLKKDILSWLLEEENAAVRYFTLICLLDEDKNSPVSIQTKKILCRSRR